MLPRHVHAYVSWLAEEVVGRKRRHQQRRSISETLSDAIGIGEVAAGGRCDLACAIEAGQRVRKRMVARRR
jgi:hypothetical protein